MATTSTTGSAASATLIGAKSKRCPRMNAPRAKSNWTKAHVNIGAWKRSPDQRRRSTLFLINPTRLRRFRNVGRLENQQERRQRYLSPRRSAGANLGSDRSESAK